MISLIHNQEKEIDVEAFRNFGLRKLGWNSNDEGWLAHISPFCKRTTLDLRRWNNTEVKILKSYLLWKVIDSPVSPKDFNKNV